MSASEPLRLIVTTKKGEPVRRHYQNPTAFKHWTTFSSICSNDTQLTEIAAAWQKVLPRNFGQLISLDRLKEFFIGTVGLEENFKQGLPVDWHLDYVVHEYLTKLGSTGGKLVVKTNAFRNYRATEIISTDQKLCCPPFFEILQFEEKDSGGGSQKIQRGFQDTHLFLAESLNKIFEEPEGTRQGEDLLARLFSWFEVKLTITVDKDLSNADHLTLEIEHELGTGATNWLNSSRSSIEHKKWCFPGFDGILLSSPNVRKCVSRLAVAWQNIEMRKLLLLAPPGSGKEVLISLFQAARTIPDEMKDSIISTELKDPSTLDGALRNLVAHLNAKYSSGTWQRPLLVVDEIHQATPTERASLLRILESDKYRLTGWKDELKLKQLIWLFAASESRSELLTKREPPDFWTRMDQIIELAHPLDFYDPEEGFGDLRRRVLADYFWMFWLGKNRTEEIKNETGRRRGILEHLLSDDAFVLADQFALSVGSPLVGLFSIRYIRGIAKRIKGEAVLFGLQRSPIPDGKGKDFLEEVRKKVDRWTIEAFKDMVITQKSDLV